MHAHTGGMEAGDEWDLSPGDVLYVPPRIPHHGVALDDEARPRLSLSLLFSLSFSLSFDGEARPRPRAHASVSARLRV